tara:strand:- start:4679 stop:6025 length:1347 start_codon:yes stop_codon:yes gene_type:complete
MSKRYLSIASSNGGSGTFGFSKGNPQLNFLVSNAGILQTQELRLQGTFKRVLNTNNAGLNEVSQATDCNVDGFIGVQSCIGTLDIASRQYSNKSLESIQNYPKLVGNFMSGLHSKSGLETQLYHEQGSRGYGVNTPVENPHYNDTNASTSYSDAGQVLANRKVYCNTNGFDFDIRLVAGMFMSEDLDLENIGGLSITINLAPDSNVLYGATASTYHYEIDNPRLVCPVITKTAQQQLQASQTPSPVINFLSFTSLYNTITSTDNQVVHKVSLRGVISSMSNFVPTSYINNFSENGNAQYNPAIEKLVYNVSGKRFPYEYSLQTDYNQQSTFGNQPSTFPQVLRNYLDSFRNSKDIKKSCLNPLLCGSDSQVAKHGLFGIGASYDAVSNAGIPAQVDTLGFEIQSKLMNPAEHDTAIGACVPINYSCYTYYLCRNSVQVIQGQGIQVVQ